MADKLTTSLLSFLPNTRVLALVLVPQSPQQAMSMVMVWMI
jgi:hypothetical protein